MASPQMFLFSSNTLANITTGIKTSTWAVPINTNQFRKTVAAKALRVQTGDRGFFWCCETKSFCHPFRIGSQPDIGADGMGRKVEGIWEGPFYFPFRIEPLSPIYTGLSPEEAKLVLPCLKAPDTPYRAWHNVIPVTGFFAFQPLKHCFDDDWDVLVDKLVVDQHKQRWLTATEIDGRGNLFVHQTTPNAFEMFSRDDREHIDQLKKMARMIKLPPGFRVDVVVTKQAS